MTKSLYSNKVVDPSIKDGSIFYRIKMLQITEKLTNKNSNTIIRASLILKPHLSDYFIEALLHGGFLI
jgi:hypothetical protein